MAVDKTIDAPVQTNTVLPAAREMRRRRTAHEIATEHCASLGREVQRVLGLATLIMALKLPVRLQVLIPAVENSISGNAYRPGDVVKTRAGLHIEIGNTDAEGRVILCDALAYAAESKPDLVIDLATLTGAARVALEIGRAHV